MTANTNTSRTSFEILLEFGHVESLIHDEFMEATFEKGSMRVNFPANMLSDLSANITFNAYSAREQKIEHSAFLSLGRFAIKPPIS